MVFGLEGLDAVGKITKIIEKLMNDAGVREKFAATGSLSGLVRLEEYEIEFTLRRRADE
jgi:hypothetical protein